MDKSERVYQAIDNTPSGKEFIRVEEPVWIGSFKDEDQTINGFLEVKPGTAKKEIRRIQAGEVELEFGDYNRQTQQYKIIVVKNEGVAAAEASESGTLAH
jgi:hypothetical protein